MTSWIKEKVKNRKFSLEFLVPLLKSLAFILLFVVVQVIFYLLILRKIIKTEDLFTLNITLPNLLQLLSSLGFVLVEFFAFLIIFFSHKLKLWILDCFIKLLGSIKIKNTSYQDRIKRLKALFKKRDYELNNTITAINYFSKLDSNDKLQIYNMLDVLDKIGLNAVYSLKTDKFTFEECYNNLLYSCKNSKFLYISGIAQYEFIGKYLGQLDTLILKNNNNTYSEENIFNILQINPKIDIQIMLLNPSGLNSDKYIESRIQDIGKIMSIDQYKGQITSTIKAIEKLKAYKYNINYILFDDKPIFRYYITDSYLYLAQYLKNFEGHEAIVYEFKNINESMYNSFMKLFLKRFERFSK